MRNRRASAILPLVVVACFAAGALIVGGRAGGSAPRPPRVDASSWRGLVGDARPQAALGQRMIVVLRAPSLAERVARAGGLATDRQERTWTAQAYAAQTALISQLGAHGLRMTVEYSYARVLNGFSAALDGRAAALLERSSDVAGVYPVRAAYPAAISTAQATAGAAPGASLQGRDGRGVTVALLDTGVDRSLPELRGHVLAGYDILDNATTAVAQASPLDPGRIEEHGTEMAGIVVGRGGVAPGASVLPIRVAGWQLDAQGRPAVFARSDQLVAGLERAVDPNEDGDAHDAARVALLSLAEPYAAFADSPESRAVDGALKLDTLVVAAAGNDGPAGPGYGSISGPGGAAGALTVGAADLRSGLAETRVVLRTGLTVGFDRLVPLAGSVVPEHRVEGEIAAPQRLFDGKGFSRVAGRIALLAGGPDPATTAALAAQAGASAVLLSGRAVPGGAIGIDGEIGVPVASIPPGAVAPVLRALRHGRPAVASVGAPEQALNALGGRAAAFSSRGLAFDGRLKPDVLASGVGVLAPGPDGAQTVTGSSAAAAVAAGAAALLAEARPGLGAADLRGLLTGTARPVPGGEAAQGTGLVDVGGAGAAELVAEPSSLPLGRGAAGRSFHRTVTLRSLSPRPLRVFVGAELEHGAEGVVVQTPPHRVLVPPHGVAGVDLGVRVDRVPRGGRPALGMLVLSVSGGDAIRVPFTLTFARPASLIRTVTISAPDIRPSDATPALLTVTLGGVSRRGVPQIRPAERLDLQLATRGGVRLGLLARLRDLLPGRYVFGLTGRGPDGEVLPRGAYRLTVSATPTDGGPPSQKQVEFHVK